MSLIVAHTDAGSIWTKLGKAVQSCHEAKFGSLIKEKSVLIKHVGLRVPVILIAVWLDVATPGLLKSRSRYIEKTKINARYILHNLLP